MSCCNQRSSKLEARCRRVDSPSDTRIGVPLAVVNSCSRVDLAGRVGLGRCRLAEQHLSGPTALGPVANTDTKLLIYSLFQKGRVCHRTGCHAPWARSWATMDTKEARAAAPGPERASLLRPGSPGLDSEPLGGLFSRHPHGPVSARFPIWRKRGTRKSRLETKTENEASSALLARLW